MYYQKIIKATPGSSGYACDSDGEVTLIPRRGHFLKLLPSKHFLFIVYVEWAKKMAPCKFRDDFRRPI